MQSQDVWMITREYGELAGAGGVKDVVAQLAQALAQRHGCRVQVVLPLYGFMKKDGLAFEPVPDPLDRCSPLQFRVRMDYAHEERWEEVRVLWKKEKKVTLYCIESPRFSEKQDVYTYSLAEECREPWKRHGEGHYDYFAMNVLLQKAALQVIMYLGCKPDILHCHDGHTALIPAIVAESEWLHAYFRSCAFLVTLHNAGIGYHQEVDDLAFAQAITGLPTSAIDQNILQGNFDPLLAAARYGMINTVSENYALELQQTVEDERAGGLGHHLLAMGCTLEGITNGVDPALLDPRKGTSLGLAADFDPRNDAEMEGKTRCKIDFLEAVGLQAVHGSVEQYGYLENRVDWPLFTFVGRFTDQKGVDILAAALQILMQQERPYAFVILGSGVEHVECQIHNILAMPSSQGHICFLRGYDAQLASRVYAAGDFFVLPSRYEPCGLTDFIAQLFGNIPLVHHVGGLVKVRDGETGFAYHENSPSSLAESIDRAARYWQDKEGMRRMQKAAVALIEKRYTWNIVKDQYLQLYRRAKERCVPSGR